MRNLSSMLFQLHKMWMIFLRLFFFSIFIFRLELPWKGWNNGNTDDNSNNNNNEKEKNSINQFLFTANYNLYKTFNRNRNDCYQVIELTGKTKPKQRLITILIGCWLFLYLEKFKDQLFRIETTKQTSTTASTAAVYAKSTDKKRIFFFLINIACASGWEVRRFNGFWRRNKMNKSMSRKSERVR